jgi:hypothetical protein
MLLLSDDESKNLHTALNGFELIIENILKLLNDAPHSTKTNLDNAKTQMNNVLIKTNELFFLINRVPGYIDSMRKKMQKSHAYKEYCETLDSLETIKTPVTRLINMMDKCKSILKTLDKIIPDSLKLADSGHALSNTIFTTNEFRRKTSKDHHSARGPIVNIVSDDESSPKSHHLEKSTPTRSSGRSMNKTLRVNKVSPDENSKQSDKSISMRSSSRSTKKTHHANTVSPDENSKQSVKSPSAKTLKKRSPLKPKPPSKTRTNNVVNYKKRPGRKYTESKNPRHT